MSASDMKALQRMDEASVREQIRGQAMVPWWGSRDNFFTNIIGGIGQALVDGLRGVVSTVSSLFNPVRKAATQIRDGQLDLKGRTDLLDQLLNYGSVYVGSRAGRLRSAQWHRVNFDSQISTEMRGCEVVPDGGIRLLNKGMWDLRAHIVASNCVGLLLREFTVDLRVVRPDGSTFSSMIGRIDSNAQVSVPVISSVQIPEPGYEVQVWVFSYNYTAGWGGGR